MFRKLFAPKFHATSMFEIENIGTTVFALKEETRGSIRMLFWGPKRKIIKIQHENILYTCRVIKVDLIARYKKSPIIGGIRVEVIEETSK